MYCIRTFIINSNLQQISSIIIKIKSRSYYDDCYKNFILIFIRISVVSWTVATAKEFRDQSELFIREKEYQTEKIPTCPLHDTNNGLSHV